MKKADLSANAFRYWSKTEVVKYPNSRICFIQKETVSSKYSHLIEKCTNLDNLLLASSFCQFTNLPYSHITKSNNSSMNKILNIIEISGFKFINFQLFLDEYKLNKSHTIYIEKCHYFASLENKINLTKSLCMGYY